MKINICNIKINGQPKASNDFCVDRRTPFGNPFVGRDGVINEKQRDVVCDKYNTWFKEQIIKENKEVLDYLNIIKETLKKEGIVNLYCWCYPRRCHSETIKKWLEENI